MGLIKTLLTELFDSPSTFKTNTIGKRNDYGNINGEKYEKMTKEKVIIWDDKNKIAFQYIFVENNENTMVHLYPYFETSSDELNWNSLPSNKKAIIFIDALKKIPKVLKRYIRKFGDINVIIFRPKTEQMGRIYSSKNLMDMLYSNFKNKYDFEIVEKDTNYLYKNSIIMKLK